MEQQEQLTLTGSVCFFHISMLIWQKWNQTDLRYALITSFVFPFLFFLEPNILVFFIFRPQPDSSESCSGFSDPDFKRVVLMQLLVWDSTPGGPEPAAQTHSSHVHVYCSMPNAPDRPLPSLWPAAASLLLKSDFPGTIPCFGSMFNLLGSIGPALVQRWFRLLSL